MRCDGDARAGEIRRALVPSYFEEAPRGPAEGWGGALGATDGSCRSEERAGSLAGWGGRGADGAKIEFGGMSPPLCLDDDGGAIGDARFGLDCTYGLWWWSRGQY